MKRRLLFALMAILAVSLLFVGCPTDDPAPTTKPVPGTSNPEDPDPEDPATEDENDPEEIESETPVIDDALSQLGDKDYNVGDPAVPLVVVPVSTPNSASYTFEWWQAESEDVGPSDVCVLEGSDTFFPPTNEAGTFYYYAVIKFGSEITTSKVVIITVN